VLLAGGESRRMGRDKEKVFVSARTESSWLPDDTELLLDEPPSRGPLSGLTKALSEMETSHLLVLAVDMPFVTREQLYHLCSLATEGCGVVPMIGARWEPLAAVYSKESALDFAAALASSDFSLQALVRKLAAAGQVRMVHVLPQDEHLYRSLNSPSELDA
jgi:molybdopterin-guanine dinucleotide biosynthesis protein A